MRYLTIPLVILLAGCGVMSNPASRNGLFDTQAEDCSIFAGEAEYHGRATESQVQGAAYIRRGTCTDQDRAAYDRSTRAQ